MQQSILDEFDGLKADLIRNHSRATLQIAGARQIPATPMLNNHIEIT